jgi:hypothetical protein
MDLCGASFCPLLALCSHVSRLTSCISVSVAADRERKQCPPTGLLPTASSTRPAQAVILRVTVVLGCVWVHRKGTSRCAGGSQEHIWQHTSLVDIESGHACWAGWVSCLQGTGDSCTKPGPRPGPSAWSWLAQVDSELSPAPRCHPHTARAELLPALSILPRCTSRMPRSPEGWAWALLRR